MPITIDNNTLVQIIVRRGTDNSRKLVVLAEGELGYTTDTQRLFAGDGLTYGGNIVANKFLSTTVSINSLSSNASIGDTTYDPFLNNLYAFTTSGFKVAGPDFTNGSVVNLGVSGISVSTSFAGSGFSITGNPGVLKLDSSIWSISGKSVVFGQTNANFGNIARNQVNVNGVLALNGTTHQALLSSGSGVTVLSSNGTVNIFSKNQFPNSAPPNLSSYDINLYGSTYVYGMLSANISGITVNNTGITTATTLSAFTNTQPTTSFIVQSGNHNPAGSNDVFVAIQYNTNNTSTAWQNLLTISSKPFVGVNTNYVTPTFDNSNVNFAVSGNVYFISPSATFTGSVTVSGDIIADFTASDLTLKTNVKVIDNALEKITKLKGVEFDWIKDYIFTGHDIGVLAQDVEQVTPEAVKQRLDGYKGVKYEKLIPLMIEAIKQLNDKVSK